MRDFQHKPDIRFYGSGVAEWQHWFIGQLALVIEVFDIVVCAYAVMSNHCYLVLNIVLAHRKALILDAVIDRWCRLYRGPDIIQRYRQGETLTATQRETVTRVVEDWRTRLSDLSWFMRCLNEYIARRANAEDRCTGRFWEGRFKSEALLDETALITEMTYVDLNPIRAGLATSPAVSEETSVKQRLEMVTRSSSGRADYSSDAVLVRC